MAEPNCEPILAHAYTSRVTYQPVTFDSPTLNERPVISAIFAFSSVGTSLNGTPIEAELKQRCIPSMPRDRGEFDLKDGVRLDRIARVVRKAADFSGNDAES